MKALGMNARLTRKLNLLVLDDDPATMRLVTKILETALGDRLAIASLTDPEEARAWLDRHCCDILISDIEMPGMDGLDVLRFAKRRNAWTQVVFLTGHSTWDRIAEAVESGASDYLVKPINRQELVELVTHLCSRYERWQTAVLNTLEAKCV